MSEVSGSVQEHRAPPSLRALIARDLSAVRPLPSPRRRAFAVAPLGVLLLMAAPLTFELRADLGQIGWIRSWGASILQMLLGVTLVAAALREAVPGTPWSRRALSVWLVVPIATLVVTTLATWLESPTVVRGPWWRIAGMCFTGSMVSAIPAVALGAVLAARAYPTRPAIVGALVGLGAGVMADGGWRLFCHFSQLDHVLAAHLGAVVASGLVGAAAMAGLARVRPPS